MSTEELTVASGPLPGWPKHLDWWEPMTRGLVEGHDLQVGDELHQAPKEWQPSWQRELEALQWDMEQVHEVVTRVASD